jgi:hypothetical protein
MVVFMGYKKHFLEHRIKIANAKIAQGHKSTSSKSLKIRCSLLCVIYKNAKIHFTEIHDLINFAIAQKNVKFIQKHINVQSLFEIK